MSKRRNRRRKARARRDWGRIFADILGWKDYDGQFLLAYSPKSPMGQLIRQYEPINRMIYLLVLLLSVLGVIVQYSASCYYCANEKDCGYDPFNYAKKQLIFVIFAFVIIYILEHVNYQLYISWITVFAYLVSVGLIVMLKSPLGVNLNGATRWLRLPGFMLQPSELAKVAVIMMLAFMAQRFSRYLSCWWMTVIMWGIGALPAGLVLFIANDLSSAAVLLLITFLMTLVLTRNWKLHLFFLVLILAVAAVWVYGIAVNMPDPSAATTNDIPFREKRILAWLAPETYYRNDNIGYQTSNTLYAVGAGGLTGNGIGTFQRLKNLITYAYSDVIFCVIIYELGAVGGVVFLLLYAVLIFQMIRVCINGEELYGSAVVLGVLTHIALQVMIHVAVVLNMMPNTGQTLPWVSYGGTTLVCLGIEIGLVMSVHRVHVSHLAQAEVVTSAPRK